MSKNKPEKQIWTTPVIQVLPIKVAQGTHPGPYADKHGNISAGSA